ncbi:hypothetical protein [Nostoc sp.]
MIRPLAVMLEFDFLKLQHHSSTPITRQALRNFLTALTPYST